MPRLERGQVSFDKMELPLRTCHDIRLWRACANCQKLGSKNEMVQSSKDQFWHGRCFVKKFGLGRLLEMPNQEISKLSLGDLGARLMGELLDGRK